MKKLGPCLMYLKTRHLSFMSDPAESICKQNYRRGYKLRAKWFGYVETLNMMRIHF